MRHASLFAAPPPNPCSQQLDLQPLPLPAILESQTDVFVKQKSLGLIHINVHSLTLKIDKIKVWALQTNADIFVFSETWLMDLVNDDATTADRTGSWRHLS